VLLRFQSGTLRVSDSMHAYWSKAASSVSLLRGLDRDTTSRPHLDIEADELVMV
jgi:hypothetical protein